MLLWFERKILFEYNIIKKKWKKKTYNRNDRKIVKNDKDVYETVYRPWLGSLVG